MQGLRPQSLPWAPLDSGTSSEDAFHRGGGPPAGACGGSRGCAAWAGRRFEAAWGRGHVPRTFQVRGASWWVGGARG